MRLWCAAILVLLACLGGSWSGLGFGQDRLGDRSAATGIAPARIAIRDNPESSLQTPDRPLDILAGENGDSCPSGELGPAKLRIRTLRVVHADGFERIEPLPPSDDPEVATFVRPSSRPRPPPGC